MNLNPIHLINNVIDHDIQNRIYYTGITILCALLACYSLNTHKFNNIAKLPEKFVAVQLDKLKNQLILLNADKKCIESGVIEKIEKLIILFNIINEIDTMDKNLVINKLKNQCKIVGQFMNDPMITEFFPSPKEFWSHVKEISSIVGNPDNNEKLGEIRKLCKCGADNKQSKINNQIIKILNKQLKIICEKQIIINNGEIDIIKKNMLDLEEKNEIKIVIGTEYKLILGCMFILLLLMWFDIIDLELYSYISFMCIFNIFILVYSDLYYLKKKIFSMLSQEDVSSVMWSTGRTNQYIYWEAWYSGFALCFVNEYETYMCYLPLFAVLIFAALCINYIYEFFAVDIDVCALTIFLLIIMLNFAFCGPQIFAVVFVTVFLYMFNFYDYSPILKLVVLSSAITVNLLIINMVHDNKRVSDIQIIYFFGILELIRRRGMLVLIKRYSVLSLSILIFVLSMFFLYFEEDNECDDISSDLTIFSIICGFIGFLCLLYILYNCGDIYNGYTDVSVGVLKSLICNGSRTSKAHLKGCFIGKLHVLNVISELLVSYDVKNNEIQTDINLLNKLFKDRVGEESGEKVKNETIKLPFYMFHNANVIIKIIFLICLSVISYTITLYFGVFPMISDALVLFAPCICLLMYSYIPGQQVFLSVFLFMINVFAILIDFKYTNLISFASLLVMVIGIIYFHLYSPLHIKNIENTFSAMVAQFGNERERILKE